MIHIHGSGIADTLLRMYHEVRHGTEISARGMLCRNVRDVAVDMDASVPPITSFKARNFSLSYAKKEWLWYLTGDRFNDSIMDHAKMWQKLKQPDGSFFSNYGHYMFAKGGPSNESQFEYVCRTLMTDENSRRASMMLLDRNHLFDSNVDTVCTYAINFSIEQGQLHMTVMMRSNDIIFGFTNDAFCFWNLYQMVLAVVRMKYRALQNGRYVHFVNSLHVYERHYDMIEQILQGGLLSYEWLYVPSPTVNEVFQLISNGGKYDGGTYSSWLQT